jgi:hypothetical protein
MPMWRCPHCGTPQAETARCWVCRRSSTTCSTCRHFRRSVAAQIGYCGLDRQRLPLAGTEIRGCWEAGAARAPEGPPVSPPRPLDDEVEAPSPALRLRDFVPVELVRREAAVAAAGAASAARKRAATARARARAAGEVRSEEPAASQDAPVPSWDERVTLFAEADL